MKRKRERRPFIITFSLMFLGLHKYKDQVCPKQKLTKVLPQLLHTLCQLWSWGLTLLESAAFGSHFEWTNTSQFSNFSYEEQWPWVHMNSWISTSAQTGSSSPAMSTQLFLQWYYYWFLPPSFLCTLRRCRDLRRVIISAKEGRACGFLHETEQSSQFKRLDCLSLSWLIHCSLYLITNERISLLEK